MGNKNRRYMAEAAGVAALLLLLSAGWKFWNTASYEPAAMSGYESVDGLQHAVAFGGSPGAAVAVGAIWLTGIFLVAFLYYQIRSRAGRKGKSGD